jgi:gliding motility-associated-like protein
VIVIDGEEVDVLNLTTPEDTPLDFCFIAEDVDGDITSIDSYSNLSGGGNLIQNASGVNEFCFTFNPVADFNGLSSWTASICDDGGLCAELTINIDVTPVNDIPIAKDTAVSLDEDTEIAILLRASDKENDPLTYSIVSQPTKGTLTGAGANRTYKPNANYFGPDSFTFKVNDGFDDSNVATVLITVNPVNDAPIITAISILSDEDSVKQVCLNVTDYDGDDVVFDMPSNLHGGGTMSPDPNFNFCYIFTPDPNYNGESRWSMKVCDDDGACGTAEALITIIPVNDPPVATDDYVDQEGGATATHDVLANDLPIEAPFQEFYDIYEADSTDVLTIYKVEPLGVQVGTATIVDNMIEYTPSGPNRIDSVRYWIVDSGGLIDSAVLYINVGPLAFHIYEALSPNGDEINDHWQIDGIEQDVNCLVRVFDRFNNLVYEITGYDNEIQGKRWEGQSNHGLFKSDLPEGTYYYAISIDLANDNRGTRLFSGFVFLKRN